MASTSIAGYRAEIAAYGWPQRSAAGEGLSRIERHVRDGRTTAQAATLVTSEPAFAQRARAAGVLTELAALTAP